MLTQVIRAIYRYVIITYAGKDEKQNLKIKISKKETGLSFHVLETLISSKQQCRLCSQNLIQRMIIPSNNLVHTLKSFFLVKTIQKISTSIAKYLSIKNFFWRIGFIYFFLKLSY
jgi:hypothetical protein